MMMHHTVVPCSFLPCSTLLRSMNKRAHEKLFSSAQEIYGFFPTSMKLTDEKCGAEERSIFTKELRKLYE